ncbi:thioredoxin family protein [Saccharothrix syringae]|uniref:Thioredoxin n=1 Tax=Saccharothrix syringae TaxID=103733 RepID=A0A5Q0HBY2_SACSY|nr:thioredoxin domain-containing protein [Saccharothrix syringae]QFZ23423.1 thiol reductase thioredoxin [Saccharothrix syringae]
MRTLTDETFTEAVRTGTVLVEFRADWCGPCRMLEPVLAEIDRERDDLVVAKLDTDANPRTARDQRIMSAPTLQLYRDGELVAQTVGARPKIQLMAWLEPHL